MKKFILSIAIGCMVLLTASCNIEFSNNGDLDGLWQLAAVDTLATDGHTDLRESNVGWAFQGQLLELKRANTWYICKFTHADGMLTLGTLHFVERNLEDPEIKDDSEAEYNLEALRPYGVNALGETFKVVTLTSSTMVLESAILRLHFRKY